MSQENLNYELNETIYTSNNEEKIKIDSLLNNDSFFPEFTNNSDANYYTQYDDFDSDNLMAQHMDYYENYNIKMLHHITNYYQIPKGRLKKDGIIELIIQFENNPDNSAIVYNRKRLWHYINELKNDNYFNRFIIF
jgi:hypothetical protein